jgi:hypothetical protein
MWSSKQSLLSVTQIILTCKDKECGFVFKSPSLQGANLDDNNNDERKRTTDFAVNIMYVIGFESVGDDGGVEAAQILGLLGLPNDTTMESRSFPTIEERINPKMERLALDIMRENLILEVKESLTACGLDDNDFEQWKQSVIINEDGSVLLE